MRMVMVAALAAAQIAAVPAQASERPGGDAPVEQTRSRERAELSLAAARDSVASPAAVEQAEEPRKKKRKSTGDKVLTGAAIVLGVGALAVGGLLIAIFAS